MRAASASDDDLFCTGGSLLIGMCVTELMQTGKKLIITSKSGRRRLSRRVQGLGFRVYYL